jgi:hypothetical protein|tara:strand:- start:398 stop:655 length:258 start_codon:yes stop_codon:yes gene_type:complete
MKQGVEMQKNRKQFYITELNMGIDGLESYTDHSGPFTLNKARKIMERLLKGNDPWVNPYMMSIRGPRHDNQYGHRTEFYSHREDR